jgi:hypothetical protein
VTVPGLQGGWRIAPALTLDGAPSPVKTGSIVTDDGERQIVMQIDDGVVVRFLGEQSASEHVGHVQQQIDAKHTHEHGGRGA